MNWLQRLRYGQNWNVGFCEQGEEDLLASKALGRVRWMRHPYRDRWFADPFILRADAREVVLFVEECPVEHPKGILCELVVDRKTCALKERRVLLELDTHLSYPFIIRHGGKVYCCPENGASGALNLYEYDEVSHTLVNPVRILEGAVADATILHSGGVFYLMATRYPRTQEEAWLYSAPSLSGPYLPVSDRPVRTGLDASRPGGAWILSGKGLFRPVQDCIGRYGAGLWIMSVESLEGPYSERKDFRLSPVCRRYGLGLHTVNFAQGICVVDGCGYLYPSMYYAAAAYSRFKRLFNRNR